MEKTSQNRPILRRSALALSLLVLAACAPRPGGQGSLPAPQVRVQGLPTAQASATLPATMAPENSTETATPASEVAALAQKVYGARLIVSIFIPAIQVSSQVVPVGWRMQNNPASTFFDGEWDSPGPDVGWAISSALPDDGSGNILLYGHNNMYSAVFRDLGSLTRGDKILLVSAQSSWPYQVEQVSILPVLEASAAQRATYLAYLQPTDAPRLTLISCWPPVSNTHRVVVVAVPVASH